MSAQADAAAAEAKQAFAAATRLQCVRRLQKAKLLVGEKRSVRAAVCAALPP